MDKSDKKVWVDKKYPFRFDEDTIKLLDLLAIRLNTKNRTKTLEYLIFEAAKKEGIKVD
jgi:hypothetical protein